MFKLDVKKDFVIFVFRRTALLEWLGGCGALVLGASMVVSSLGMMLRPEAFLHSSMSTSALMPSLGDSLGEV